MAGIQPCLCMSRNLEGGRQHKAVYLHQYQIAQGTCVKEVFMSTRGDMKIKKMVPYFSWVLIFLPSLRDMYLSPIYRERRMAKAMDLVPPHALMICNFSGLRRLQSSHRCGGKKMKNLEERQKGVLSMSYWSLV